MRLVGRGGGKGGCDDMNNLVHLSIPAGESVYGFVIQVSGTCCGAMRGDVSRLARDRRSVHVL